MGIAGQVSLLPAVQNGFAILVGSAAWGTVSPRSDIDLVAFKCQQTTNLESDIDAIRSEYQSKSGNRHAPPIVDVIWIGAEKGQVVERDNILSGSAPIAEHRVVKEIFERTCSRLIDHLLALAGVKGGPWQSFIDKYMINAKSDSHIRQDILREYADGLAARWRENNWKHSDLSGIELSQLKTLGNMENFAYHTCRLILSDHGIYPRPDRRPEIRNKINELPDRTASKLQEILMPAFQVGEVCETMVAEIQEPANKPVSEMDYYSRILSLAEEIEIGEIEHFVWDYTSRQQDRS
jgi:predicted nucleotidyltransferase